MAVFFGAAPDVILVTVGGGVVVAVITVVLTVVAAVVVVVLLLLVTVVLRVGPRVGIISPVVPVGPLLITGVRMVGLVGNQRMDLVNWGKDRRVGVRSGSHRPATKGSETG